MKIFSLFFCLGMVVAFGSATVVHFDEDRIIGEVLNRTSHWKPAKGGKFSQLSNDEFSSLLGLHRTPHDLTPVPPDGGGGGGGGQGVGLPESFDAREKWGGCIYPVRNQGHCGSCWAFSGTDCLGDRLCIVGRGVGPLSPEDLVECDTMDGGCDGGNLDSEWTWMTRYGVATDTCIPYTSEGGSVGRCPSKCVDGSPIVRYKAKSYTHVSRSAGAIQEELYNRGPMEVAFSVYEDFRTYSSGVYHHVSGSYLGGHAVLLIGWGVDGGVPYWLIQNSWGGDWGIGGHFKIARGRDECGIEDDVYAAIV